MGGIGGGGSKGGGGGGQGQFNYGISPFDMAAVMQAGQGNADIVGNRYDQLGLGGSTMAGMDLGAIPSVTGGVDQQLQAALGQLETQNQGNPALNPALQPPQSTGTSSNLGTTLGTLAKNLGGATTGGATTTGTTPLSGIQ